MGVSMADVFVDCFAYSLGERKLHVRESAADGRLLSAADDLESAGFRWHHICEPATSAYDLAAAVTAQLARADQLGEIDAIVYATCLPGNGNAGDPAEWERTGDVKYLMDFPASRLQADFDLRRAVVFGLNQQACTAMLGSMRLAAALLAAEPDWERVLCVTADRFPPGARLRAGLQPDLRRRRGLRRQSQGRRVPARSPPTRSPTAASAGPTTTRPWAATSPTSTAW